MEMYENAIITISLSEKWEIPQLHFYLSKNEISQLHSLHLFWWTEPNQIFGL